MKAPLPVASSFYATSARDGPRPGRRRRRYTRLQVRTVHVVAAVVRARVGPLVEFESIAPKRTACWCDVAVFPAQKHYIISDAAADVALRVRCFHMPAPEYSNSSTLTRRAASASAAPRVRARRGLQYQWSAGRRCVHRLLAQQRIDCQLGHALHVVVAGKAREAMRACVWQRLDLSLVAGRIEVIGRARRPMAPCRSLRRAACTTLPGTPKASKTDAPSRRWPADPPRDTTTLQVAGALGCFYNGCTCRAGFCASSSGWASLYHAWLLGGGAPQAASAAKSRPRCSLLLPTFTPPSLGWSWPDASSSCPPGNACAPPRATPAVGGGSQ